jgi:uncharacterized 2Fe-2S/4Fe-4S cluster protein (DUF4445 family)
MKKVLSLLLVPCLVAVASMAFADEKPLDKPGILNEEAVMTSQRLSTYDTIVIKDFSTDGVVYDRINDEEKLKVDSMKSLIVKNLTLSLEMELKNKKLFKNIVLNGDAKEKGVILEGNFTEFNGGSRAMRFFVGFGAGRTYLKVKGHLVDAQSGKELASFEDIESGFKGANTMESLDELFPEQARGLGEHIVEYLEKLY